MYKMPSNSRTPEDVPFEDYELSQIETKWKELRNERDLLKQSQYQNLHSIKRLELNVTSLLDSRDEDGKKMQKLEDELKNRSRIIEHLQFQLEERNKEIGSLKNSFKRKSLENDELTATVFNLRQELEKCVSRSTLIENSLLDKQDELRQSCTSYEKLESSIASLTLESECEVESLKLDLIGLEESFYEAKLQREEAELETQRMRETIKRLEGLLKKAEASREPMEKKKCTCVKTKKQVDDMGIRLKESEALVEQLKKELREEKLKAKEEAEDLAQEMAELRYQTGLIVEEECKRRACIEQASLQRIAHLEAQVQRKHDLALL